MDRWMDEQIKRQRNRWIYKRERKRKKERTRERERERQKDREIEKERETEREREREEAKDMFECEEAVIFNSQKQASTRGLRNTSLLRRNKKNCIKEACCSIYFSTSNLLLLQAFNFYWLLQKQK